MFLLIRRNYFRRIAFIPQPEIPVIKSLSGPHRMAGTAHLAAALKYIELGNYTANQLLIPFMIAPSNILNEIFREKFSHNRDHCSPPPASGPGLGAGWAVQLGAALVQGLTQGAGWHRSSWLSWVLGAGDGAAKAPWPGWRVDP